MWSEAEDALLREQWPIASASMIAAMIPRSRNAIIGRARRMGFGGKLCIHPAQVQPLHAVFDPDPAAVTQAQRLCQALAEAGGGVCVLDGRMVDAPVLHLAQQTLARHAWALQRMHRKT